LDAKLIKAVLASHLPAQLASDLVVQFLQIRQDVATRTLGRSAPGKFVESVVQALQQIEQSRFDMQPNVDDYLKNLESRPAPISDGLRICVGRVARSMYTLRNKRNILHKGDVDPNDFDQRFLLAGAQWIMAEFVREFNKTTMQEAGKLIDQIQSPVGGLVEDFGPKRLIYGTLSAKEEILVLLHSYYPEIVSIKKIVDSLDRRNIDSVKKAVRELWRAKLVEGSSSTGYRITVPGVNAALNVITSSMA
jgi:hypothetical protein